MLLDLALKYNIFYFFPDSIALMAYYFKKAADLRESVDHEKSVFVCCGFSLESFQRWVSVDTVERIKDYFYDCGCLVITCDGISSCAESSKQVFKRKYTFD